MISIPPPRPPPNTHTLTQTHSLYQKHFTFESNPVRVGFNISVVVTLTFGEKAIPISLMALGYLCRNLVCMLVVEQGRGQSEGWLPSNRSGRKPKMVYN